MSDEMGNEMPTTDNSIDEIVDERRKFASLVSLVKCRDDKTFDFDDVFQTILPDFKTLLAEGKLSSDDLHKLDRFGYVLTCEAKLLEAVSCFETILSIKPNFLKTAQNLDNIKHQLIERWHFGMLNDSNRNAKYKSAIKRAIRNRGDVSVLDIGTGTGLLALYANESGANRVFACEQSPAMCDLSMKAFQLNGCDDRIKLIPKHSTEIDADVHMNGKADLVITETMDCGVFGEGLLQTLIHAKENLLKNSGQVIPARIKVFIAGFQSRQLAAERSVINSSGFTDTIYLRNHNLTAAHDEPYDSCYVQQVSDFKLITKVGEALDINLNNLNELNALFAGSLKKNVQLAYSMDDDEDAILDGFCAWFRMSLDADDAIIIDTNPFGQNSGSEQESCWECAIFRLNHRFDNSQKLQNLNVTVSCEGGVLRLNHFYDSCGKTYSKMSPECVRFLNDTEFIDRIEFEIFAELKRRSRSGRMPKLSCVLDFLPFPTIGIALLKENRLKKLYCSREAQEFVTFIANANCISLHSIAFIDDPADVLFIDDQFELIVLPMIEKLGTVASSQVANYTMLKNNKLKVGGFMVPERVDVIIELINSNWMRNVTRVTDPEIVDRLKIGGLINKYATTIQMDLSDEFPHKCVYTDYRAAEMQLNDGFYEVEHQLYVGESSGASPRSETNAINGVLTYFKITFTRSSKDSLTTKRRNSFARLACFACNENTIKRDNGFVTLKYQQNSGVVQISLK